MCIFLNFEIILVIIINMYNQNNDRNTTSLFELVDNDFMV